MIVLLTNRLNGMETGDDFGSTNPILQLLSFSIIHQIDTILSPAYRFQHTSSQYTYFNWESLINGRQKAS